MSPHKYFEVSINTTHLWWTALWIPPSPNQPFSRTKRAWFNWVTTQFTFPKWHFLLGPKNHPWTLIIAYGPPTSPGYIVTPLLHFVHTLVKEGRQRRIMENSRDNSWVPQKMYIIQGIIHGSPWKESIFISIVFTWSTYEVG